MDKIRIVGGAELEKNQFNLVLLYLTASAIKGSRYLISTAIEDMSDDSTYLTPNRRGAVIDYETTKGNIEGYLKFFNIDYDFHTLLEDLQYLLIDCAYFSHTIDGTRYWGKADE